MRPIQASDIDKLAREEYRAYMTHFHDEAKLLRRVMEAQGVEIDPSPSATEAACIELRRQLESAGARFRNDGKSIVYGALSPACARCRTGVRSVSEFISLACDKACWFCFNPNQCDYETYRARKKDCTAELDAFREQMGNLDYVALTGGEPLLFPQDTLAFFQHARTTNPNCHTRLYTSGTNLTEALLRDLAKSGLEEIRFSLKLDATPAERERVWAALGMAVGIIPSVMIEMPVIPGTEDEMKQILERLDQAGAFGINLLEFCFPLHNAQAYAKRGLKLSANPYRIPYDYGYAGALPIAGSEELALRLMLWGIERGLGIGMHYCSLENKNTAQVYAQNEEGRLNLPHYRFSPRTFFYETIRAFEAPAKEASRALDALGLPYGMDEAQGMIAFDPAYLSEEAVSKLARRKGLYLASGIIERDETGSRIFKEVGLQVIEPGDEQAITESYEHAQIRE